PPSVTTPIPPQAPAAVTHGSPSAPTATAPLPPAPAGALPAAPPSVPVSAASATVAPAGPPASVTAAPQPAPIIATVHLPAGVTTPPSMPASTPAAPPASMAAPPVSTSAPLPTTPTAATLPNQTFASRPPPAASMPARVLSAAAPSAQPAGPATNGPPRSLSPAPATQSPPVGSAAGIALRQATQAAARQDSVAPLLQNLAALHGRMAQFPRPVAEAALRLLAGRLVVGNTAPDPVQLKQAVLASGVLTRAPTAATTTPADLRTGLQQLRSALLGFLGAQITPVAPVARRPPPPTRDSQPRGFRTEPATLPENVAPRDAGRTLLHQTDAALARIRLLQLASLPQDAARAGAPPAPDLTLDRKSVG